MKSQVSVRRRPAEETQGSVERRPADKSQVPVRNGDKVEREREKFI